MENSQSGASRPIYVSASEQVGFQALDLAQMNSQVASQA